MMNNVVKNKVSFDFDSTLDREDVQEYAKHLIENGVDVWVTTARCPDNYLGEGLTCKSSWNNDLWNVTESLGIPKHKVVFTAYEDKFHKLSNNGFIWHLDDDETEIELLEENNSDCFGINVCLNDWLSVCERHLIMNISTYTIKTR